MSLAGVIRMRGATLDLDYLHRWAPHLGVAELLERALAEILPLHDDRCANAHCHGIKHASPKVKSANIVRTSEPWRS